MQLRALLLIVCLISSPLISNQLAFAETATTKRGLITTTTCPYSCQDAGLHQANCREWQSGDVCEIEDFSQAPGHRSLIKAPTVVATNRQPKPRAWRDGNGTWLTVNTNGASGGAELAKSNARGLVTTSACPYDCRRAGLESKFCREWQEGETCHVEDLLQAPGHRTLVSAVKD